MPRKCSILVAVFVFESVSKLQVYGRLTNVTARLRARACREMKVETDGQETVRKQLIYRRRHVPLSPPGQQEHVLFAVLLAPCGSRVEIFTSKCSAAVVVCWDGPHGGVLLHHGNRPGLTQHEEGDEK